jgi:hypothetical protein
MTREAAVLDLAACQPVGRALDDLELDDCRVA